MSRRSPLPSAKCPNASAGCPFQVQARKTGDLSRHLDFHTARCKYAPPTSTPKDKP